MTHHETNIKACEILLEIESGASDIWGYCQMYTAEPVKQSMIDVLTLILSSLKEFNKQMER